MPFTFAHPAAVIRLQDKSPRYFDSTALILGSMAPDFEYFLRFKAKATIGHTLGGFFYFNLPMILIVALVWHYIIKKPFILSIPSPFRKYFSCLLVNKWNLKTFKSLIIFIISGIIGMCTHVLWDSFTHRYGFFVMRIPILSKSIEIIGTQIPIYKIIQHGSTLIGFGIIFLYLYLKSHKTKTILPRVSLLKQCIYWILVLLVSFGVVIIRAIYTLENISLSYYGIYIVSFISGLFIAIFSVSCIFQIFNVYRGEIN